MKAISPDPQFGHGTGQGKLPGNQRHRSMKSGVKAGDLRHIPARRRYRPDERKTLRHMHGIKRG